METDLTERLKRRIEWYEMALDGASDIDCDLLRDALAEIAELRRAVEEIAADLATWRTWNGPEVAARLRDVLTPTPPAGGAHG